MRRIILVSVLALGGLPSLALAAQDDAAAEAGVPVTSATPNPVDLLFDRAQLKNTKPNSTITYDYVRRSGISRGLYGPPLNDEIKLKIDPGKNADNRDVEVQMFSGANRIPAGPFEDMPGNPVIPLFLENHLKGLAALLEANPRYIKNAIRKGLRDKATITPAKIDFKGKQIEGWQVVTKPFLGDPQTEKLRGFDNLTYTFITSPEVPGEIVSIEAQAQKPDGGELLEEKLSYDQDAG